MRELARVEGRGRFARVYYKNGATESVCLTCFATEYRRASNLGGGRTDTCLRRNPKAFGFVRSRP